MLLSKTNLCYCSLVPRSSNNSQAHLKFCFAKGACSLLNHVLTQPDSKCLAAVCPVTNLSFFQIKSISFLFYIILNLCS